MLSTQAGIAADSRILSEPQSFRHSNAEIPRGTLQHIEIQPVHEGQAIPPGVASWYYSNVACPPRWDASVVPGSYPLPRPSEIASAVPVTPPPSTQHGPVRGSTALSATDPGEGMGGQLRTEEYLGHKLQGANSSLEPQQRPVDYNIIYPPRELVDDGIRAPVQRAPLRVPHAVLDLDCCDPEDYRLAEYNSSLLYLNMHLKGTSAYRELPFLRNQLGVIYFLPKGTPMPRVYKRPSIEALIFGKRLGSEAGGRTWRRNTGSLRGTTCETATTTFRSASAYSRLPRDTRPNKTFAGLFRCCSGGPDVENDDALSVSATEGGPSSYMSPTLTTSSVAPVTTSTIRDGHTMFGGTAGSLYPYQPYAPRHYL